jgi:alpha-beta hydrolase superfamily lysophospholipase
MAPALTIATPQSTSEACSTAGGVRRMSFYITSQDEPLFTWLHAPLDDRTHDHVVILCPSIGFEQVHAHRSVRHLADALARRRIAAIRFDWHGTGDSAGSDADADRLETWTANVRDVVQYARHVLGFTRVSIVGLRVGALVAAQALADLNNVDQFVLWSPVAGGRSFVRQMQAIDKTAEIRPIPPDAADGDIEAAGFLLTEETADRLGVANLMQCQPKCRRALVVAPYDRRVPGWLTQLGIAADESSAPGYAEMMAEPHFSVVPQQALDDIVTWLAKGEANGSKPDMAIRRDALDARTASISLRSSGRDDFGDDAEAKERPLHFGGEVDLFGIVSEPSTIDKKRPAVIVLNAGAAYRVGPGRLNVELTRHLASRGFLTLRMDANGLGDSVPAQIADENNPYPETVFRDIEAATRELRARYGIERCVVVGLCSGAYAAFQAAAQLGDPALIEAVLVNPVTFFWKDGMSFDAAAAAKAFQEHCRMTRAWNGRKLLKFLRGQTEVGYVEALGVLARRAKHAVAGWLPSGRKTASAAPAKLGHPAVDDLAADIRRVVAARRTLALFLADTDPGFTIMKYHAPRETKELLRTGALHVSATREADHTFSRRAPRAEMIESLGEYLAAKYAASSSDG